MIGKESLRFTKSDLLDILFKQNFTSKSTSDVWIIYPTFIYDIVDEFAAFEQFKFDFFYSNKTLKMKSFVSLELACICFRPKLMTEDDFTLLKEAVHCFTCESPQLNSFCLCYGITNMP